MAGCSILNVLLFIFLCFAVPRVRSPLQIFAFTLGHDSKRGDLRTFFLADGTGCVLLGGLQVAEM